MFPGGANKVNICKINRWFYWTSVLLFLLFVFSHSRASDYYRTESIHNGGFYPSSSLSEQPYQLRVVYIIPSDRVPHPDYEDRLDYFLKKVQSWFSDTMKAAGYADAQGNGKTFRLELNTQNKVVVYLIDHRPGGNDPNPALTAETYNGSSWEGEVDRLFGSQFRENAVIFAITDKTVVTPDHRMSYGWHGGGGLLGPGNVGHCTVSDHVLGNDTVYGMADPPLVFNTIGRNDSEQAAIFRDARFTNIIDGSRVYHRGEPVSWMPGEYQNVDNMRVWEWASVYVGATIHELGHAFGLKHCFRFTPGATGNYPGDYNLMGNGFRHFYKGLMPSEIFTSDQLYPRLASIPGNFGEGSTLIHESQYPILNRNQFFNGLIYDNDRTRPVVERLRATYDPDTRGVLVDIAFKDQPAAPAPTTGISHIAYALDWNIHKTVAVNGPEDSSYMVRKDLVGWNNLELANPAHLNNQIGRGVHLMVAEPTDRAGNPSDFKDSIVWFGVDEYYIEHWLIWSKYFDAWPVFYDNIPFDQQLQHDWLGTPDEQLEPALSPVSTSEPHWRYFFTGAFLDMVPQIHHFFDEPLDYSVRRVCYAATRLHSNRERTLNLRSGYNDYVQIFLNGVEIYMHPDINDVWSPTDRSRFITVPVTLNEGKNLLLVKHFNHIWDGGFMVWFNEPVSGDAVPIEIYPPADPDTLSVIVPPRDGIMIR